RKTQLMVQFVAQLGSAAMTLSVQELQPSAIPLGFGLHASGTRQLGGVQTASHTVATLSTQDCDHAPEQQAESTAQIRLTQSSSAAQAGVIATPGTHLEC